MNDLELFDHVFVDNGAEKTVFLLHGTGGGSRDFLFLDEQLGKKFNLVGLQGNVMEQGMRRFFKRIAVGVFDQESIRVESEKLHMFVAYWIKKYQLSVGQVFALGYSNGANILLGMIFYYPQILRNLVLLHPMLPFDVVRGSIDLSGLRIFVSNGVYDEMVSEEDRLHLSEVLVENGAKLTVGEYPGGHEIGGDELADVVRFLGF